MDQHKKGLQCCHQHYYSNGMLLVFVQNEIYSVCFILFFTFIYTFDFIFSFFFQAEDGIRDLTVTGVQTCALPISTSSFLKLPHPSPRLLNPKELSPNPHWESLSTFVHQQPLASLLYFNLN